MIKDLTYYLDRAKDGFYDGGGESDVLDLVEEILRLRETYEPGPRPRCDVDVDAPWVIVHRDGPETERVAAEMAEDKYPERALRVIRHLVSVGGDYDSRGAERTGMWLNSYAPARNGLMRRGLVVDSGRRETNARNRLCIVWIASAAGIDWMNRGSR